MIFFFTFTFIAFANFLPSFCDNNEATNTYRLPNQDISVTSHTLHIVPNIEADSKFTGDVSILLYVYSTTNCLTLNSKNLKINTIQVRSTRITYTITEREIIPEKEMLKICVSPYISYTSITITINYEGIINDDFKGLYKIPYMENGSKKWQLATQFEPTYARMVLPCFDEPQYRADYILSLQLLLSQEAISITEVDSKEIKNNHKFIRFRRTKSIPPHLMAFAIHEFTSSAASKDAAVTVATKIHKEEYVQFFTSEFQKWFKELQEYLKITFQQLKLSLITTLDADEHSRRAGLLFYKESDVFQVTGVDVEKHKEEIAKVAIHKLAHLWFNSIVVPRWWDDTWLCESFARYFEYFISGRVEPKWEMEKKMGVEMLQNALYEEGINDDSALSSKTDLPSEIEYRKFNNFINNKGASILRMLHHIVTEIHFSTAIHDTLMLGWRRGGLIEPDNLWYQIQNKIYKTDLLPKGVTIQDVMNTWMKNSGYPLLKVSKTPQSAVVIEQEEYQFTKSLKSTPSQSWMIPITCTKQSSIDFTKTTPTLWLLDTTKYTTNIVLKDKEWILCNLQQIGYYRVNYTEQNWALLVEQLKSDLKKIDVTNRAQLLDDSFNLAMHNKLNFRIPLQLGTYLMNEREILPWIPIIKYVKHFLTLYERTSASDYLKHYFKTLFQRLFQEIGFSKSTSKNYLVTTYRPLVLEVICNTLEIQECIEKIIQTYNLNINNLTKVPEDHKHIVYCHSFKMYQNEINAWDKLWSIFTKSDTMSERELILKSLACANEGPLLKKYIMMALKPADYRLNNYEKEIIINSVPRSFQGVEATLNVIEEIIPILKNQSQATNKTLITLSNQIITSIQSMEHQIQLKRIITKIESRDRKNAPLLESLNHLYDQGLKTVEQRDEYIENIKKSVHIVTGYVPPPPTTLPPPTTQPSKQSPQTNTQPEKSSTPIIPQPTKAPKASSSVTTVIPNTTLLTMIFGLILRYMS